jgi:hypothetical protein
MSLADLLFKQSTQVALCAEFAETLADTDDETALIVRELRRVASSATALPLELTWCVLCIMYTCAETMHARISATTPGSVVRKWFGTPAEYRAKMEARLCGVFLAADRKAGRRGKVVDACMTPVQIVAAAWDECVFEMTKPADIVARENHWVWRSDAKRRPGPAHWAL